MKVHIEIHSIPCIEFLNIINKDVIEEILEKVIRFESSFFFIHFINV